MSAKYCAGSIKKIFKLLTVLLTIIGAIVLLNACGKIEEEINMIKKSGPTVEEPADLPPRDPAPRVDATAAPGAAIKSGGGGTIDFSNIAEGYVMCAYEGSNPNVKVQVTYEGQQPYTYSLMPNSGFSAFPLSQGNGNYTVALFTNVSGDQYAQAASTNFNVQLQNDFSPFLHPNQYADFTASSACVTEASSLVAERKTDLGAVEDIFIFVTKHVSYDHEEAATVKAGYIPNPDDTLASGKGICFDYASLTTSMLRSQGIPTRLVVGYAGDAYHAWISIHVAGVGWVDGIIEFKDEPWTRMDPTFTASGDKADPNVVGDGTNYNPLYYY